MAPFLKISSRILSTLRSTFCPPCIRPAAQSWEHWLTASKATLFFFTKSGLAIILVIRWPIISPRVQCTKPDFPRPGNRPAYVCTCNGASSFLIRPPESGAGRPVGFMLYAKCDVHQSLDQSKTTSINQSINQSRIGVAIYSVCCFFFSRSPLVQQSSAAGQALGCSPTGIGALVRECSVFPRCIRVEM